jgi:hypothetical protein
VGRDGVVAAAVDEVNDDERMRHEARDKRVTPAR